MTEDISRQLSDSEKNVRVIDDHKRRKKVKISTGNIRDGGEWDFRSGGSHWNSEGFEGSRWQLQQHLPNSTGCCSYLWISKLMIIIFTLTNLLTIACGGVVFTLGLTGYWSTLQIFSYIMIGSSCLMCWGTLATTMDVLALLGIFQKKKRMILPWLLWYMMEVITISGLVMLSVVYTESFYLLPTLIKPLVNMFAWYNVRYVYKHYFITLYTRRSNILFY